MTFAVGPVFIGKPAPFRGEEMSAIRKAPAPGKVVVGALGLAGDEVADRVHHGGVDMAVHHYPHDHYGYWREQLGDHPLLAAPGAFGENITTSGLTEGDVHIGDRFRLGSALVEVSQGRQPCWKIDHKFEVRGLTAKVLKTGRCGWYYRVLEPGEVAEGDAFELAEPASGGWSVARVFALLFHKHPDPAGLETLATLPALSQNWKERAARLLGR